MFTKKKAAKKKNTEKVVFEQTEEQTPEQAEQQLKISNLARSVTANLKGNLGSRFATLLVHCAANFVDMDCVDAIPVVRWFLSMRLHLNELLEFLKGTQFLQPSNAMTGIGSIVAYHGAIMALVCWLLDQTATQYKGDDVDINELVKICYSRESEKHAAREGLTSYSYKTYVHSIVKPGTTMLGFNTLYGRFVGKLENLSKLNNTFLPRTFAFDQVKGNFDVGKFTPLHKHCQDLSEVLVGVFGADFNEFEPVGGAPVFIKERNTSFLDWAFQIGLYGEETTGADPKFEIADVKAKWKALILECFPTDDNDEL